MDHERRIGGRETWHRLREWDKGQSESERLAARLLPLEGFVRIDPSHPLGGPDGGKDIVCKRDAKTWIVAAYSPRGHPSPEQAAQDPSVGTACQYSTRHLD